ncbi:Ig-like domain-containing protein [Patescibacteria group bacterium]|nr:Ig-like domain-containing protein [Patescibacteria group bacterium]
MLKSKKITVLFIFFFAVIFLLSLSAPAQADVFGVNDFASSGVNLGTKDLKETIAGIVNIFLGFLGILTTLIILYGGFIWMTSQGNTEKIDRAKKIIINGVIGLVIVLSSYAIARFVLREGYDNTFGTGGGSGGGGAIGGVGLGAGALESHYPPRDAVGVPRNTNIYLTFEEPIDIAYMVEDTACTPGVDCVVNSDYISLLAQGNPDAITGVDLPIIFIPYNATTREGQDEFLINPYGDSTTYLGSPSADVRHTMQLGNIQTLAGTGAFVSGAYSWRFTVGTELDLTPPTVTYIVPPNGSTNNPKNSAVQINFSEAVDSISAAGFTADGFDNVIVSGSISGNLGGRYTISNQYRTVEFITDQFCGENSCGGSVFCLPGDETINGLVSGTATDDLVADREEAIVDMAGNVLDCGTSCSGSDYVWSFTTNNVLDLTPPFITQMEEITDVDLNAPISVEFSEELLSSSVNSSNISLDSSVGALNYWTGLSGGNVINIYHDKFSPTTIYTPTLSSGIKDSRQNCWYPCLCQAGDNSCTCTTPDCSGGPCTGAIGTP